MYAADEEEVLTVDAAALEATTTELEAAPELTLDPDDRVATQ